jgi:hypothetical protein
MEGRATKPAVSREVRRPGLNGARPARTGRHRIGARRSDAGKKTNNI